MTPTVFWQVIVQVFCVAASIFSLYSWLVLYRRVINHARELQHRNECLQNVVDSLIRRDVLGAKAALELEKIRRSN